MVQKDINIFPGLRPVTEPRNKPTYPPTHLKDTEPRRKLTFPLTQLNDTEPRRKPKYSPTQSQFPTIPGSRRRDKLDDNSVMIGQSVFPGITHDSRCSRFRNNNATTLRQLPPRNRYRITRTVSAAVTGGNAQDCSVDYVPMYNLSQNTGPQILRRFDLRNSRAMVNTRLMQGRSKRCLADLDARPKHNAKTDIDETFQLPPISGYGILAAGAHAHDASPRRHTNKGNGKRAKRAKLCYMTPKLPPIIGAEDGNDQLTGSRHIYF